MFGRTEPSFFLVAVSLIGVAGAAMDLAIGKIYNAFNLPVLLLGLGLSTYFLGLTGLGAGALGAALGLVLYGWMFAIRVMGGGDVKFLMALGAWGGAEFAVKTALLGVLAGGALAVVLLAFKGKLPGFIRRMRAFTRSLFVSMAVRDLEVQKPQIDSTQTMPYGVPIAIAAIWIAYEDPFVKWGIALW